MQLVQPLQPVVVVPGEPVVGVLRLVHAWAGRSRHHCLILQLWPLCASVQGCGGGEAFQDLPFVHIPGHLPSPPGGRDLGAPDLCDSVGGPGSGCKGAWCQIKSSLQSSLVSD